MCIYIYIYIYVCVCVCTRVRVRVRVCACVSVCVLKSVFIQGFPLHAPDSLDSPRRFDLPLTTQLPCRCHAPHTAPGLHPGGHAGSPGQRRPQLWSQGVQRLQHILPAGGRGIRLACAFAGPVRHDELCDLGARARLARWLGYTLFLCLGKHCACWRAVLGRRALQVCDSAHTLSAALV